MTTKSEKVFTKAAVKAGVYKQTWLDQRTDQIMTETVYVSPQYLRESAWNTMQMMRRGLEVPVCLDHQDDAVPTPTDKWLAGEMRSAVGRLKAVRFNALTQSHEYDYVIDDKEIEKKVDDGTIRLVSPNFHTEFSPGDGSRFPNVIAHLALTFRPKDYSQSRGPMEEVAVRTGQNRFSVLTSVKDSGVLLVPMHKLRFSVLQTIAKDTPNGVEFASTDYKFKFANRTEFNRWLAKRYQRTLRMSVAGKFGHVLYFAVVHAPIGGVTINGRKYLGGQFIPTTSLEGLTQEDRSRIEKSSADSQKRRAEFNAKFRNDDETWHDAIKRHVGEHAGELSEDDQKAAARRLRSLSNHHGENVMQRIASLAGTESAQLAKLAPDDPEAEHIKRRLAAYHAMSQNLQPKDMPKPEAMKQAASETAEDYNASLKAEAMKKTKARNEADPETKRIRESVAKGNDFSKPEVKASPDALSPYETEEDKEGNIRGVANMPNGEKIKGKWVEKNWHNQDGDDKMHAKLKRDLRAKYAHELESAALPGTSTEDFRKRGAEVQAKKEALMQHLHPRPEGRPEVLASYEGADGYTRNYRIKSVPHTDTNDGVGYQLHYDRVDPESGNVVNSDNYGPVSEKYDHAAEELALHGNGLIKNGHGGDFKINDPVTQKKLEERNKRDEAAAKELEYQQSAEAERRRNNAAASAQLRSELKGVKKKQHSMKIGDTQVKGVKYGDFLIHRPVPGDKAGNYVLTHIPSGLAGHKDVHSQEHGIELAHLLSKSGDWSNAKPDKDTMLRGRNALVSHGSGEYARALDAVKDSKKKVDTDVKMAVVHAPAGGADAHGHHYLGGQFTPGEASPAGQHAVSPKAQEVKHYYSKADAHARGLGLKPQIVNLPGLGKVRSALVHGNLVAHPVEGKWRVTHSVTGKRVGQDEFRNNAVRKMYLLHHGLAWDFNGDADPVHAARFKDVARGVVPRDLPEHELHPHGAIPGGDKEADSDVSRMAQAFVAHEPNYKSMKDKYIASNASFNPDGSVKSVPINTDDWRDHIPGYVGTNAHVVHDAASAANNRFLDEMLSQMKGKGNGKVAILAGGSGSGKGTSVGQHFDEHDYPLRIDQTSDNYDKLLQKVNKIKEAGFEPDIVFVDRSPQAAWHGVVGRAVRSMEKGSHPRTVPHEVAVAANIKAREAALRLARENPDVKLRVIDNNSDGPSRLLEDRDAIIEHLAKNSYNIDEEKKGALEHVNRLESIGKIPSHVAKGLRGEH